MTDSNPPSDRDEASEATAAVWPKVEDRYEANFVPPPHPATWEPELLLARCELRTQRRSGPGGQHRNKTSSGVFLTCSEWNIMGEATERRSQAQNRVVALQRLRFRLAIELRSGSVHDRAAEGEEAELRAKFRRTNLKLNEENVVKPAVLALVLDDLHAAGGQPSLVGEVWETSTSAVVGLVRSHAAAFAYLNAIRTHHGRHPLRP